MKISKNGLTHLIKIEGGAQLTMYNDLGPNKGHCTIGVGHLIHKGVCNGVIPSEKPYIKGVSLAQAENLLKSDLKVAEDSVNKYVTVKINQNQYDSLVSFVFNVGSTAFKHSTLLRNLNSGNISTASNEFLKWDKMTINGVKKSIQGLLNRRIAEKSLFDKAIKP